MKYRIHLESADGLITSYESDEDRPIIYRELKIPVGLFEPKLDNYAEIVMHAREYRCYKSSGRDLFYIEEPSPHEKPELRNREQVIARDLLQLPEKLQVALAMAIEVLNVKELTQPVKE